jgi:acetylglutamate kinase
VGDILKIDSALLENLLNEGYTPVVATIGVDRDGQLYNVNADTTAAAIAGALAADAFHIVTDSGGLKHGSMLVDACDRELFDAGKQEGWINGGMLVKLTAGFDAVTRGVSQVCIVGADSLGTDGGTHLIKSTVLEAAS